MSIAMISQLNLYACVRVCVCVCITSAVIHLLGTNETTGPCFSLFICC
uniref:Uncharacterized protein n=1 Tax=Anguilla anguilla TaxID=7936 RepID=A0A0E9WIX6_ANGAN